jgi:phenylpyruvate tautomerase PptA (4-oxalocrotonate tautomerase family)|tara:strand:- start:7 stop:411 length:405 start_codon:yes stop_codon:yes gene_type:complete
MLKSLIGPVAGLLDKFIEDKDQKNKLAHDIATMAQKHAHESNMAQVDVNKTEAQHRSVFVAGWRPFIGWVCGVALAYHFILYPIVVFILASFPTETFTVEQLPKFDMDSLMTVLLGMLGLGGLRTFEKSKGLTK